MMMSLTSEVPAAWVSSLRPYLQHADDFAQRQPVVAYFLRTHAAFLAMRLRKKGEQVGTKFLMKLLDALEEEKKQLASALINVDGRTVLTKYALMLFTKADDEERSGAPANMNLVRLFFASSVLFEATGQFTEDGELDPIAAEKRNYARYIAVRMKKSIASGTPYLSPNAAEGSMVAEEPKQTGHSDTNAEEQQMDLPPPSYSDSSLPRMPAAATVIGTSISSGGSTVVPSMDAMINAQNHARQAVSALQFYDHVSARHQLIAALTLLDQK